MKKPVITLALIINFLLIQPGCKMYDRVTLSTSDFFSNEEIKKDLKDYNVYIHDKQNTYKLIYPMFRDSTLHGKPELVFSPEEIEKIKEPANRKEIKEHKLDINVFSNTVLLEPTANIDQKNIEPLKEIKLNPENIDKVEVYASDAKSFFALIAVTALLVIGAVVIAYLIIHSIEKSSDGSNSNSNSGDSGSGDSSGGDTGGGVGGGSNSGGSDSGGSDSGGSNSGGSDSGGSGCYIATMVYGTYDAPEVLVLRKFRDEILGKYSAGRYFIKIYYKYSPGFVNRFRNSKTVNKNIKAILDRFIQFLSNK